MVDAVAPISVGELIDKITILRIKLDKIRDGAALANVKREFDRLMQIREPLELAADVAPLEEQLLQTNLRSERLGDFGARFIALARSVYTLNDRRSALKLTAAIQPAFALTENARRLR